MLCPRRNQGESDLHRTGRHQPIRLASPKYRLRQMLPFSGLQGSTKLRRNQALVPRLCDMRQCYRRADQRFLGHGQMTTRFFLGPGARPIWPHITQPHRHNRQFGPQQQPLSLPHPSLQDCHQATNQVHRWHRSPVPVGKGPMPDWTARAQSLAQVQRRAATSFQHQDNAQSAQPIRPAFEWPPHRRDRV